MDTKPILHEPTDGLGQAESETRPLAARSGRRSLLARFRSYPTDSAPRSTLNSPLLWLRRAGWAPISFVLCVVIPSIGFILYFATLAAPQFVVEARFIVRTADVGTTSSDAISSAVSALSSSLSYSPSAQNSYVVAQYIKSRAAIDDLEKLVNLREIFRRPEADFWARLKENATAEELVDYWKNMVRAYVDAPSTIVTVEVKAFRPDDALTLCRAILTLSEQLVNRISERARLDVMRSSEEEVRRANGLLRAALQNMQTARDAEGVLDPAKASDETGKLLMQLMVEKTRLEGDLYFAQQVMGKDAPSVRQLSARSEILDRQLTALKSTLAGRDAADNNMAASLRRFEELEAQRILADKLLTFAEEGLERARIRAERQNLYFMVFVAPMPPNEATLPLRVTYSILLPIACFVIWGMFALIWAAVEDHRI